MTTDDVLDVLNVVFAALAGYFHGRHVEYRRWLRRFPP